MHFKGQKEQVKSTQKLIKKQYLTTDFYYNTSQLFYDTFIVHYLKI